MGIIDLKTHYATDERRKYKKIRKMVLSCDVMNCNWLILDNARACLISSVRTIAREDYNNAMNALFTITMYHRKFLISYLTRFRLTCIAEFALSGLKIKNQPRKKSA